MKNEKLNRLFALLLIIFVTFIMTALFFAFFGSQVVSYHVKYRDKEYIEPYPDFEKIKGYLTSNNTPKDRIIDMYE